MAQKSLDDRFSTTGRDRGLYALFYKQSRLVIVRTITQSCNSKKWFTYLLLKDGIARLSVISIEEEASPT